MLFPIEPFLVDILIGTGAVLGILAGRWGFEPIARPQQSTDLDAQQRPTRAPRSSSHKRASRHLP